MLSEMEQRIRECYDAFLEAVTEDRDLWEIALLGKPVEWRMGQTDDRYGLLRGLLDQEKVRLLYDGVRGGDSRCGDMLTELLTSGAVTREALEQLSPNRCGVNDWPDTWYEEALERIEG